MDSIQGASQDPEKFALFGLVFQDVLCEAKALGIDQPKFIAGDVNLLPLNIPTFALCMKHGGYHCVGRFAVSCE